ncbi:rab GTPase-activating protein 22-like isoform X3 [Zingiber officinale]|uniref:rab GTPase-activating protein 22-like isoform X3 n=1 Tax=Zingiber officinale TaxID=94328 RepID=UPI001C4CDEFE|nr:rab GTPase-activating protein 22-like isoform X3 [Zingiber officinale]
MPILGFPFPFQLLQRRTDLAIVAACDGWRRIRSAARESMWGWSWLERGIGSFIRRDAGSGSNNGGAWIWGTGGSNGRWHDGIALGVTAMAGLALAATLVISSRRGGLKSPWSGKKRKRPLTRQQWNTFFLPDGKLRGGGVKFLKKGIDPSIRAEVWPFLLGVYDLSSSRPQRILTGMLNRKEYEKLRKQCQCLTILSRDDHKELKAVLDSPRFVQGCDFVCSEEVYAKESVSIGQGCSNKENLEKSIKEESLTSTIANQDGEERSSITHSDVPEDGAVLSGSESSVEDSETLLITRAKPSRENNHRITGIASANIDTVNSIRTIEDFAIWQRIIRLDSIRANTEWIPYSPVQAAVSEARALKAAADVGLTDYEDLEPCRIYHATRLVAVLEAYALYDPVIGYCQGMSDLLTPILSVMEEDHEAFWCFVGFMKKARHNFRLDEVGIRRQLNIVSKVIKFKDLQLYEHLEKLQAEDCFFVYRMVVVVFRRELTFQQTLCLWEAMWADQAAIRAGYGKSAWGRMRLRAPPTDDLLLYAIAASVLQRRKLIIERYSSMDEILRECNSMAGQLDVWKLLDDAHDLVATLHDKID